MPPLNMAMLEKSKKFLWGLIELLWQLLLLAVLLALILGEDSGTVIQNVFTNVKDLLAILSPSAVAVAAVFYLGWRYIAKR